nr:putative ribonuclease H-like domain-containing protein [Tanacetum cinerariifolium]
MDITNERAICVVKNHVYHSKTKHIEIRHYLIRDSYEKRLIEMVKIHTDFNDADLFTKAFDVTRFQFLVVSIGLELKGYLINDGYADLVQHAGLELKGYLINDGHTDFVPHAGDYFNNAGVFLLGFHPHNKWSSIHDV